MDFRSAIRHGRGEGDPLVSFAPVQVRAGADGPETSALVGVDTETDQRCHLAGFTSLKPLRSLIDMASKFGTFILVLWNIRIRMAGPQWLKIA